MSKTKYMKDDYQDRHLTAYFTDAGNVIIRIKDNDNKKQVAFEMRLSGGNYFYNPKLVELFMQIAVEFENGNVNNEFTREGY